jgi:cysteinyl-tRNA synthetase
METKVISPAQIKLAGEMLKKEHSERLRLEKVAADFEKKAKAEKLAFREVELGITEPYKNFDEFQKKVASLLDDDLEVLEKALDRGYGSSRRVGELADAGGKVNNPFEHFVRTGELVTE